MKSSWTKFGQNINYKIYQNQGRSDGVSRVRNAYGPTAEGGPSEEKIYTRYLKKMAKIRNITNFGRFAYGPTRPSLRLWQNGNFLRDIQPLRSAL
jgi:hypothetical protein